MQEHIQHAAPLLPVDLVGQEHRPQDHAHLEHAADGPGNHLAEEQAVGGGAGDEHLDGPVALLIGDGHRNHLAVVHNQHEHDDDEHVAVPIVAAGVLVQNLLRDRDRHIVHGRNLPQIPALLLAVAHPVEELHGLVEDSGVPVRHGLVVDIVFILGGPGDHESGLSLLGLHRGPQGIRVLSLLPEHSREHSPKRLLLQDARLVHVQVQGFLPLPAVTLCLLPAAVGHLHAGEAGHVHEPGQEQGRHPQDGQDYGEPHEHLIGKIFLQFIFQYDCESFHSSSPTFTTNISFSDGS